MLLASLLVLLLGTPCMAAVQEICYLGRITALDPLSNTLVIRAESQYSCDYATGGSACVFKPVSPIQVVGTVPDEGIYNTFRNDDLVVATIIAGSGNAWAAIALVSRQAENQEWVATEISGDPKALPVSLAGNYRMDYGILPDCSACSGSTCKALSARVFLWSGETPVVDQFLNAGHSAVYSGRNDGSSVSILFLSGEADAGQCPQAGGVAGIMPVSTFIIHVVPPIGQAGTPGIITRPTPMGIEPKVTPQATPAPTRAPLDYLLAPCSLAAMGLVLRRRLT